MSKVPPYQEFMLPILRVLGEAGTSLHQRDYSARAADFLKLPDAQRAEMLPSGQQEAYYNRCGWAGWYMQQAGLFRKPKRGHLEITDLGRDLLATNPGTINNQVLRRYPAFVEKMSRPASPSASGTSNTEDTDSDNPATPDEQIDAAIGQLRKTLVSDLRDYLAAMNPFRFE